MTELNDEFQYSYYPNTSEESQDFMRYLIIFISDMHGYHFSTIKKENKTYFALPDGCCEISLYQTKLNNISVHGDGSLWRLRLKEKKPLLFFEIIGNLFTNPSNAEYSSADGMFYEFEWSSIDLLPEWNKPRFRDTVGANGKGFTVETRGRRLPISHNVRKKSK